MNKINLIRKFKKWNNEKNVSKKLEKPFAYF